MRPIGGVFSVALSLGYPKFALRTTVPYGVRTFLPGLDDRSDHAFTPHPILLEWRLQQTSMPGNAFSSFLKAPPQTPDILCSTFAVYSLIRQLVGPAVLRPGHMHNRPFTQAGKSLLHLLKQRQQEFVFYLILPLNLANDQF